MISRSHKTLRNKRHFGFIAACERLNQVSMSALPDLTRDDKRASIYLLSFRSSNMCTADFIDSFHYLVRNANLKFT